MKAFVSTIDIRPHVARSDGHPPTLSWSYRFHPSPLIHQVISTSVGLSTYRRRQGTSSPNSSHEYLDYIMAIGSHLIDTIESRLYTCPNSKVSIEGTEVEIPNNAPGPIEDQIITPQIRMHYRDWGDRARAPSSTCWRCTVSGHHAIGTTSSSLTCETNSVL